MLGNFTYCNPTRLYFGEGSLERLNEELPKYGETVQLVYGGGSIKKNGIYDQVVKLLHDNGKRIVEDGGVMPNPTVEKLYEGSRIARENNVDLILAVGGGSCCDYAKAVSISAWCQEDPLAEILSELSGCGCGYQNHSGGLRIDDGRNRQRDEWRRCHHQP